jgi:hypothetical protein
VTCIFLAGALWLYAPSDQLLIRLDEVVAVGRRNFEAVAIQHEGGEVNSLASAAEIVDAIAHCPEGPGITWERPR